MAGKDTSPIPEIALETLESLAKNKIPFIIEGGAAMVLHGIPRSTLDIDIIVPAVSGVVEKLFMTANHKYLSSREKDITIFKDRPNFLVGQWINFKDKDGSELIDVFFEEEKEFDRLLKSAKKVKIGKFNYCIASLKDLETMKRESGRPLDMADIALIKERRSKKK